MGDTGKELEPLQKLLENLQLRLCAVENHVGLVVKNNHNNNNTHHFESDLVVSSSSYASTQHKRNSSTASSVYSISSSTMMSTSEISRGSVQQQQQQQQENATNDIESSLTVPLCLQAFDVLIESSLVPFLDTLIALDLQEIASHVRDIWNTQRSMIQMATHCKKPTGMTTAEALQTHLLPIQTSIKAIQQCFASKTEKKYRSLDTHGKAIQELLVSVSWLVIQPPPMTPSTHIKETLSSTEFWTNKIRKEYKAQAASSSSTSSLAKKQVDFCDAMKKLIVDMATYVKEYHFTGLSWNPHGVITVQEYPMMEEGKSNNASPSKVISSQGMMSTTPAKRTVTTNNNHETVKGTISSSPPPPPPSHVSSNLSSSNTTNTTIQSQASTNHWMKELESKQSQDGNSAATGLKKVTKDQQTWRKEYVPPSTATLNNNNNSGKNSTNLVTAAKVKFESQHHSLEQSPTTTTSLSSPRKGILPSSSTTTTSVKNDKIAYGEGVGKPICEYQASSNKWIIENQNMGNNPNGLCTIEVHDVKTQVYMYVVDITDMYIYQWFILFFIFLSFPASSILFFTYSYNICKYIHTQIQV